LESSIDRAQQQRVYLEGGYDWLHAVQWASKLF
jgi:hypothetical protein